MKPNQKRARAPEPEPDPLIDPGQDTVAEWRADPQTKQAVKTLQARYVGLTKQMVSVAHQSSDPKIAGQGSRIQELQSLITALGGKV